ncbi:hypothetical protein BOSP111201_08680 [Bordetella sputigena]|uniref:hypothetical protein n=1 Tax=Bordetella sputigena TaxID=1416810 RepID=UPI0039EE9CCD
MTIGSLPPAVPSSDCPLPLACKAKQDAAGVARDAFAHYVVPKDIVIHHAAQLNPAPPSGACKASAKFARYAANTVRELAFTPPAAYALKAALEGSKSLTNEFVELALSPVAYVGQKLGNKIAREIMNQNT